MTFRVCVTEKHSALARPYRTAECKRSISQGEWPVTYCDIASSGEQAVALLLTILKPEVSQAASVDDFNVAAWLQ
jgi:hypothetical protein